MKIYLLFKNYIVLDPFIIPLSHANIEVQNISVSSISNISNNEDLNKMDYVVLLPEKNSSLIELPTEISHISGNVPDNSKVTIVT